MLDPCRPHFSELHLPKVILSSFSVALSLAGDACPDEADYPQILILDDMLKAALSGNFAFYLSLSHLLTSSTMIGEGTGARGQCILSEIEYTWPIFRTTAFRAGTTSSFTLLVIFWPESLSGTPSCPTCPATSILLFDISLDFRSVFLVAITMG